jgi:hypothetical protein
MATYRAIEAVSNAIIFALRSSYDRSLLGDHDLQFQVFSARDFARAPDLVGISLFVHRVTVSGTLRFPAGRPGGNGRTQMPQLPLDLHLLLTAWAPEAALEQAITGWMLRAAADIGLLTPPLLNEGFPGTFHADETVELLPVDLPAEELMHLWEVLGQGLFRLSGTYVARTIQIESARLQAAGQPVNERSFDYRPVEEAQ